MALPANPLDKFVTYTQHFELHAAPDWEQLSKLEFTDRNDSTDRFSPKGTLLINSRKDAHQSIDEVKFMAIANTAANAGFCSSYGEVNFTITEAGGFAFSEKLQLLKDQQKVTILQNLIFVLKVMFVCRDQNNQIKTIYSKLIPMSLMSMKASFDHRGGVYAMSFLIMNSMGATNGNAFGSPLRYAFTNKAVQFEASTVAEALKKLEDGLNANYEETYKNKLDGSVGKKIKYIIKWDKELNGEVKGNIKNSFAPHDASKFAFNPNIEIGNYIMEILSHSKDINEKIGASKESYAKEFHPNAFMPMVVPRVLMKPDVVEMIYDIQLYKGGSAAKFTFDYYFSDVGKNVDVMQYEVVYENMLAYIATYSNAGQDKHTNSSATCASEVPTVYQRDIVHEDKTKHHLESLRVEKKPLTGIRANDVLPPASANSAIQTGLSTHPVGDVRSVKLATDASLAFMAAGASAQQTFTIRGHLDLLNLCAAYPDGSNNMFGTNNGVWIKVNIWMPLGDSGIKKQFYYTGWYQLLSITNHFANGQFTQQLHVIAMDRQSQMRALNPQQPNQ
jgi:hypothetical protein